jgi:hypothetical protein
MRSPLSHRFWQTAVWLLMPVCGAMAQGLPQPKPVPLPHPDLVPPQIPPPGPPLWILIAGVALVLLLTAFVVWILFKKKKLVPEPQPPPLSQAQKRLQALLLQCDALPPDETAHQVSVILRAYQERRYLIPAPYRTREELYDRGEFSVRGAARDRFSPIALLCDRLAFATVPATRAEARQLIQQSLDALQQESYHVTESRSAPPPLAADASVTPPPLPQEIRPPAAP